MAELEGSVVGFVEAATAPCITMKSRDDILCLMSHLHSDSTSVIEQSRLRELSHVAVEGGEIRYSKDATQPTQLPIHSRGALLFRQLFRRRQIHKHLRRPTQESFVEQSWLHHSRVSQILHLYCQNASPI